MNNASDMLVGPSTSQLPAPLYGLVLSDSWFREDSSVSKTGPEVVAQVGRLYEWLDVHCEFVFVAARVKPHPSKSPSFPQIFPSVPFVNVLGSILSAMRVGPSAAWLVVSDTLRHLNAKTIEHLIVNRNPDKWATAFKSPQDDLPEGLCTIYEPSIFNSLLRLAESGCTSPHAALAQVVEHIEMLVPHDPATLVRDHLPDK